MTDDAGRQPSIGFKVEISCSLDGGSSEPIKFAISCGIVEKPISTVGKAESCMWQDRILHLGTVLLLVRPCALVSAQAVSDLRTE